MAQGYAATRPLATLRAQGFLPHQAAHHLLR